MSNTNTAVPQAVLPVHPPRMYREETHIKANESILKVIESLSEIELIMRQPDPNKLQLAVIRANISDIIANLDNVSYWATKKYRKEI